MQTGRAATLLVGAAALGLLGQYLFFGVPLGINLLVMVAATLAATWLARPAGATADWRDLWMPPAALALAAFVAIRADAPLVLLDSTGALVLTGASAASFAGLAVMRRSTLAVLGVAGWLCDSLITGGAPLVGVVKRAIRSSHATRRGGPSRAMPIVRGLALATPIVLLFTILFAAADAVFARMLGDAITPAIDVGEITGRTLYFAVLAWLGAGLVVFVSSAGGRGRERLVERDAATAPAERRGQVGATEALVILVAVDALFAAFVAVQAAYLFGGRDTIEASGITYSSYARRGFFELVAVAVLAGIVVMTLDALVRVRTRTVVWSAVLLCVLTGVVLASAAQRLGLYQQAYGWTELRFYVLAAIVWLAAGVLLVIGALVFVRSRWPLHGLGIAGLVITFGANVIGPQAFITEQNLARALDDSLVPTDGQSGLDELYLLDLGMEAIPAVLDALPDLPAAERERLGGALAYRLEEMNGDAGSRSWQAWSLGRERARDALKAARDDLERYTAGRSGLSRPDHFSAPGPVPA